MDTINVKRLALAFGATSAILYLGCMLVVSFASRESAIFFFNSLMHGIDISGIYRPEMPLLEMVMGVIEIFILGWLTGATIASIYNYGKK
jgi:hypothetical protein